MVGKNWWWLVESLFARLSFRIHTVLFLVRWRFEIVDSDFTIYQRFCYDKIAYFSDFFEVTCPLKLLEYLFKVWLGFWGFFRHKIHCGPVWLRIEGEREGVKSHKALQSNWLRRQVDGSNATATSSRWERGGDFQIQYVPLTACDCANWTTSVCSTTAASSLTASTSKTNTLWCKNLGKRKSPRVIREGLINWLF